MAFTILSSLFIAIPVVDGRRMKNGGAVFVCVWITRFSLCRLLAVHTPLPATASSFLCIPAPNWAAFCWVTTSLFGSLYFAARRGLPRSFARPTPQQRSAADFPTV